MPEVGIDETQNQRFCLMKLRVLDARRNSFHFPSIRYKPNPLNIIFRQTASFGTTFIAIELQ